MIRMHKKGPCQIWIVGQISYLTYILTLKLKPFTMKIKICEPRYFRSVSKLSWIEKGKTGQLMNGVSGCDDDDNSVFHPNDTVIAA